MCVSSLFTSTCLRLVKSRPIGEALVSTSLAVSMEATVIITFPSGCFVNLIVYSSS